MTDMTICTLSMTFPSLCGATIACVLYRDAAIRKRMRAYTTSCAFTVYVAIGDIYRGRIKIKRRSRGKDSTKSTERKRR